MKENIKLFYTVNNITKMEEEINNWLDNNEVEITRVIYGTTGRIDHHLSIGIFYKVSGE